MLFDHIKSERVPRRSPEHLSKLRVLTISIQLLPIYLSVC